MGLGSRDGLSQFSPERTHTAGMLAWCESGMFLTGSCFEYSVSWCGTLLKTQEVGPGW